MVDRPAIERPAPASWIVASTSGKIVPAVGSITIPIVMGEVIAVMEHAMIVAMVVVGIMMMEVVEVSKEESSSEPPPGATPPRAAPPGVAPPGATPWLIDVHHLGR